MYANLLHNMLISRGLTRQDVVSRLGVSPAAVTKYVRWLDEQEFLAREMHRKPWSKRPIEELRVRPDLGRCLCLLLEADQVLGFIARLDGHIERELVQPTESRTLAGVLAAANALAAEAIGLVDEPFEMVGMAARGYMAHHTVFAVDGIENWQPCQPGQILTELSELPVTPIEPRAACKLQGLAGQWRAYDGLGYIELRERRFHVAAMTGGEMIIGTQGTTSPLIHQRVSDDPHPCFCGRTGCLAHHIAEDTADAAMIAAGLADVLQEGGIHRLGIDAGDQTNALVEAFAERGLTAEAVGDTGRLVAEGLVTLTASAALRQLVNQRREVPA